MDSFDKGWFVLQTYSGYENKVKENLLQRAQTYNMLDNILRVEIPTQTVQVEKNGKKKEVEENRFPGYVLVEMVMTDEAWFVVRNTPNVTGFVGSHGNRSKPTPLLEEEIRQIENVFQAFDSQTAAFIGLHHLHQSKQNAAHKGNPAYNLRGKHEHIAAYSHHHECATCHEKNAL